MDGRIKGTFLLEADSFSYRWPEAPEKALKEISFGVKPGELVLCTGGSDSGKTSLALTAAALIPHRTGGKISGRFYINGIDIRALSPLKASSVAGLGFQQPQGQFFTLTLEEEVAFSLEQRAIPAEEIRKKVNRALDFTGLSHMSQRSPQSLSGGEMQRLSLAILLAVDPPLLVLDEPLAALDPFGRNEIMDLLLQLKARGKGILLFSKDPFPILPYGDRILVLHRGSLICNHHLSEKDYSSVMGALLQCGANRSQLFQLGELLISEGMLSESLWSKTQADFLLFGEGK